MFAHDGSKAVFKVLEDAALLSGLRFGLRLGTRALWFRWDRGLHGGRFEGQGHVGGGQALDVSQQAVVVAGGEVRGCQLGRDFCLSWIWQLMILTVFSKRKFSPA